MRIKLRREVAEKVGIKVLEKYGASEMGWRYQDAREIDLAPLNPKQLDDLYKLLDVVRDMKAVKVALHDIRIWKESRGKADKALTRNAYQFASLLKQFIGDIPGHRIFRKDGDQYFCYYVNNIVYVEKVTHREGGVTPAHVNVDVAYEKLGGRHHETIVFWDDDVKMKNVRVVLAEQNVYPESKELREQYLEDKTKFMELAPAIGLQLHIWGFATDDLDGNRDADDDDDYRYRRWSINSMQVGTIEEPGRGVVDVFEEKPTKESRNEGKHFINLAFWKTKSVKIGDDDDTDEEMMDDEGGKIVMPDMPEVPIHPVLAIFDLAKHLRLRLHVRNCEVHKYDRSLSEKLVLPTVLKNLVHLLIEHREGGFQDIVKGKGGGAVVMLAGPPGTGKTLTAEVYAEAEERPLYSIQCSQLGTTPDDLEKALLKCFARGKRWNAVVLLDESDVYIHTRGNSLAQNAIVGVFLRVLEYQSAVLFLTSNRPEDVDDAVLSRCVARLKYAVPGADDQKKIWRILADGAGLKIKPGTIDKIVNKNIGLSGRDVKNLLKLAMLEAKGKEITAEMIEFAKQFKPTEDIKT